MCSSLRTWCSSSPTRTPLRTSRPWCPRKTLRASAAATSGARTWPTSPAASVWVESVMPVWLVPRSESVSSSFIRVVYHNSVRGSGAPPAHRCTRCGGAVRWTDPAQCLPPPPTQDRAQAQRILFARADRTMKPVVPDTAAARGVAAAGWDRPRLVATARFCLSRPEAGAGPHAYWSGERLRRWGEPNLQQNTAPAAAVPSTT